MNNDFRKLLDPPMFQHVLLEKVRFSCRRYVDIRVLEDVKLEAFMDGIAQQMVAQLVASILGKCEDHEESQPLVIPADWWQAVRERWLPSWWLKRYPVKTKRLMLVKKTTYWRICPHVNIPTRERHLEFLAQIPPTQVERPSS